MIRLVVDDDEDSRVDCCGVALTLVENRFVVEDCGAE
jgi:hypothetical protein